MPRLLALEWDSREARVVAANLRPGEMRVEQMFCVPLPGGDDAAAAGAALAAALSERKLAKSPAVVALARSQVELKPLTLPPSPDDELPAMARLQAVREFTSLADDWPLDYLPLTDDPAAQREVLAAAISPETIQRVGRVLGPSGLEAARHVVRPFAAASRFERTSEARGCLVRLLIDLLPAEADLTVMVERRVVFARTARLSADVLAAPEEAKALVSEIRRTLAAAHTQLGTRRVEAVYVLGATPQHTALCAKLQAELNLPCRAVDPLAGTNISREVTGDLAEGAKARFAALLGALWDEAEGVAPAIDFLHPRRPPPPKRSRRLLVLAGAAAGLLLVMGAVLLFRIMRLNGRIEALAGPVSDVDRLTKDLSEVQKELDPYQEWQTSDINWLVELASLSHNLPNPDDVLFTSLVITTNEGAGKALREARGKTKKLPGKARSDVMSLAAGTVAFQGVAVSEEKVTEGVERVDPRRLVDIKRGSTDPNPKQARYKFAFRGTVGVLPREVDKEDVPPPRRPEGE